MQKCIPPKIYILAYYKFIVASWKCRLNAIGYYDVLNIPNSMLHYCDTWSQIGKCPQPIHGILDGLGPEGRRHFVIRY